MANLVSSLKIESELESALQRDEHGTETISTIDVRPDLRNAVWEARNRSHLIGLRAGSPASSGLVGSMRSAVVNGMSIADITGNAHTVERTPTMANHLPIECVMFTFVIAGESFHFNGTSPVLVRPGEVAIYDSDSPFMLGFGEGMHAVVASVPRYHLADIGMHDAFRRLKVMRHAGPGVEAEAARNLLDVLRGVFERPAGVDPHEFEDAFLENALRALQPLSSHPKRTSSDRYFTAAVAFMESHLDDPGLSTAEIADALNLSQRHLARIFAARGTTVTQHVRDLRLERARRLLVIDEGHPMTVADVGRRCGFISASHFSRVFRAQVGISPTEARRTSPSPEA
jgi:AraC-like DNA-binding protein